MRVVFNIPYRWSIFKENHSLYFWLASHYCSKLVLPSQWRRVCLIIHACVLCWKITIFHPFPLYFCFNDSLLSQMAYFYMLSTKNWKHAFNSLCIGPYLFCYFPRFAVMSFHKINAFISIIFPKLCQVAIVNVLNAESSLSYQTLYSTLFIRNFCN